MSGLCASDCAADAAWYADDGDASEDGAVACWPAGGELLLFGVLPVELLADAFEDQGFTEMSVVEQRGHQSDVRVILVGWWIVARIVGWVVIRPRFSVRVAARSMSCRRFVNGSWM